MLIDISGHLQICIDVHGLIDVYRYLEIFVGIIDIHGVIDVHRHLKRYLQVFERDICR